MWEVVQGARSKVGGKQFVAAIPCASFVPTAKLTPIGPSKTEAKPYWRMISSNSNLKHEPDDSFHSPIQQT